MNNESQRNKKFVFINTHYHPINTNLFKILKRAFTEYEIDFIDLVEIIKSNRALVVLNFFASLWEYRSGLITGHWKVKEAFFRCSYLHKRIKKIIRPLLDNKGYEFTFQTNSIFNTSIPGVPHFIYTDHTYLANLGYPNFDKKKLVSKKTLELEKKIYEDTLLNFTYSTNVANSIINDYGISSEKVKCVYAGSNVPLENFEKYNNSSEDKYKRKNILFVGIDWERKGGPDVIRAFERVLEKHPDASLTIAGANPKVTLKNVEVIGKVPVEKLPEYYSKASLFCMPTKLEPFGIVFVEAMLYKLPIVSSRIGALPDFVTEGENGYLIEPGDVEALTNALIKLLDDSDKCRQFGERGYILAVEKYTWEKVGERLKKFILEAINKNS